MASEGSPDTPVTSPGSDARLQAACTFMVTLIPAVWRVLAKLCNSKSSKSRRCLQINNQSEHQSQQFCDVTLDRRTKYRRCIKFQLCTFVSDYYTTGPQLSTPLWALGYHDNPQKAKAVEEQESAKIRPQSTKVHLGHIILLQFDVLLMKDEAVLTIKQKLGQFLPQTGSTFTEKAYLPQLNGTK